MAGQDVRSFAGPAPVAPECGEVGGPGGKVVDVPGNRIEAEPARTGLAAPIGRRDRPALPVPVVERFEVFLVGIAATGQEQQAATRAFGRGVPVYPANCVAIGRVPVALAGGRGNCTAIETRAFLFIALANSILLPVVTF
jgi:hypothetical protein